MSGSTYLDLLTLAAGELNVVAIGDLLSDNTALAQRLLDRLTWMVDSWNLKPTVIPWYQQRIFPLVPYQQSYLIGPNAPDWNAPRPIRLDPDASNLLLVSGLQAGGTGSRIFINGSFVGAPSLAVNGAFQGAPDFLLINANYPDQGGITCNGVLVGAPTITCNNVFVGADGIMANGVLIWTPTAPPTAPTQPLTAGAGITRLPLSVLSVQQWANIAVPYLTIAFPSGCYLDRAVVTGSYNGQPYTASRISVWGVPTATNFVEFFYWQQLTAGNLSDSVNAAPGYFRAMFLNLALEIAPMFGITPSALTLRNAADALGDLKELNAPDVRMQPDPGMPGSASKGYISRAQFLSGDF